MAVSPGQRAAEAPVSVRKSRWPHRAWAVAAVTFLAMIAAAAFRSSTGVLIEPVESEFGWTRTWTSGAVSLNLLLFGLTAPFAAALMERFGVRRVASLALTAVAAGTALTLVMTAEWQLLLLWGVVIGLGTGSIALVLGAIVAGRWFDERRGLVMGVFSAGSATGQLIVLPPVAWLASNHGWRWAAGLTSLLALALVPVVYGVLRDRPSDVGLRPYGAPEPEPGAREPDPWEPGAREPGAREPGARELGAREPGAPATDDAVAMDMPPPAAARAGAIGVLREVATSWPFWVLAGTFFICGWSTNGLIQTHLIPAAHDHGMPATTAASLLALVGVFDMIGTVLSGWLSDRIDARLLLLAYYGLRGLSLLAFPALLGPHVDPPLMLFIVFYGLDWVATVPPTVMLVRQWFGAERAGVVFGWVFAAHMIGGGIAAAFAGYLRQTSGAYTSSFLTAGALCLVAAVAIMMLPKRTPNGLAA
jgi:MFS family permease